jgi:hypothetical protein
MKVWSAKLKGRDLGRPRCGWENDMDLEERDGMCWIHLTQENEQWRALAIVVMNNRVP